jgi:hypothetical protein
MLYIIIELLFKYEGIEEGRPLGLNKKNIKKQGGATGQDVVGQALKIRTQGYQRPERKECRYRFRDHDLKK